jgi:hypothetical protein
MRTDDRITSAVHRIGEEHGAELMEFAYGST